MQLDQLVGYGADHDKGNMFFTDYQHLPPQPSRQARDAGDRG